MYKSDLDLKPRSDNGPIVQWLGHQILILVTGIRLPVGSLMIITKSEPFTKEEVEKLREVFDVYIKTVIDIDKKVCSAGANRHFESEKILLNQGSNQIDLWGGGVDLETKVIDYNSFINIRPTDNNSSNEIQDAKTRQIFDKLTRHFFNKVL